MNCAVCGSSLLCKRAISHCSCGVLVHAYCWEKHVLQAHQPTFEVGTIDLSGEFIRSESEVEQVSSEGTALPAVQPPTEEVTSPAE